MTSVAKGLAALIGANLIWGLAPIFYKWIDHIPATEVLCHRTLWSAVFFGCVLALQRRLTEIPRAFRSGSSRIRLLIGAALISVNWGLFIWAIQVERALEASLGYYIFPLVSVLIGVFVFGEGWGRAKVIAFTLASLAVAVLTFGLGALPWVALVLAFSFGGYSWVKKTTQIGPVVSVTAETVILTPFALAWLAVIHLGQGGAFGGTQNDMILLILSGPLTATPLILFSYASRRLQLSTVGLVQYMNPTLQFLVAVLVFAEPFTQWHAIAVPMIWVALAIYTAQALAADRLARRAAKAASTS